jgi:hypothetical protein
MNTVTDVANALIGFINQAILLCSSLALLFFIFAGIRTIYQSGDPKNLQQNKYTLLWGGVALFTLMSVYGILRIIKQSFFG